MNPFCWLVAHTSAALAVDDLWIYHLFYLALHVVGGYALFFALDAFTYSRSEARLGLLACFCCVPTRFNADGFFNGVSGSPLVLLGTVTTILAMAFIAKYLRTNSRQHLLWAGLVTFISALFHPFEVFVVAGGGGLALLLREQRTRIQNARDAACAVVPGILGLAPHVFLTLRHPWLWQAAAQNHWDAFPIQIIVPLLALPALLSVVLFLMPMAKRSATDTLLNCWFGTVLVGIYIPWVPWSHHLLDGVFYVASLLLVREAARCGHICQIVVRQPVLTRLCVATVVCISLSAYALNWATAVENAAVPGRAGASAVISLSDRAVLDWLRHHASPDDLVLAPKNSAALFATAPIHSFASHWLMSLTWADQARVSDAFYAGTLDKSDADALIRTYGVRYAVVSDESPAMRYFSGQMPIARVPNAQIFKLPSARMLSFKMPPVESSSREAGRQTFR